ncbi:hypothetical protein FITA111629_05860 [Filibacter tadaridae]|uniref:Uncharacterized protein n=1 Tax=Filibacter tadaridae TaxID=2483811 RepID=A0A3P5W7L5_9BACL|nr:hypothetical protein [Filibacter tadaridae]VDC19352.1 hypothetical protein FILTAD_00289 [Filibacter tadaridae]
MRLYREAYIFVLKKNYMLLTIATALLILTFGFWIGIPLFVVGNIFAELNASILIQGVCVFISAGLLFSLFFIPLNLKVAKRVGEMKQQSTLQTFIRLHLAFILLSAVVLCLLFLLILWVEGTF